MMSSTPVLRHDVSFIGFLIDLASPGDVQAAAAEVLERIASPELGLDGWSFIADLAELRTSLPGNVIQTTTSSLVSLASDTGAITYHRVRAIRAMRKLGDPDFPNLLCAIARGSAVDGELRRTQLIRRLKSGDTQNLANNVRDLFDSTIDKHGRSRVEAASILVELDDPRARDLLCAIARDASLSAEFRLDAVSRLASLGDPRVADLLYCISIDCSYKAEAAVRLAGLGDSRGVDRLHDLARDTTLEASERKTAARGLAAVGDPGFEDVLRDFASDPEMLRQDGDWVKFELAALHDPGIRDLLYNHACDSSADGRERVKTALLLWNLRDSRAADLMHDLARDPSMDSDSRGWAIAILKDIMDDPRAAPLLHERACDDSVDRDDRMMAAEELAEMDPRGAKLLWELDPPGDDETGHQVTRQSRPRHQPSATPGVPSSESRVKRGNRFVGIGKLIKKRRRTA